MTALVLFMMLPAYPVHPPELLKPVGLEVDFQHTRFDGDNDVAREDVDGFEGHK